jgi:hypothetical protein
MAIRVVKDKKDKRALKEIVRKSKRPSLVNPTLRKRRSNSTNIFPSLRKGIKAATRKTKGNKTKHLFKRKGIDTRDSPIRMQRKRRCLLSLKKSPVGTETTEMT